MKRAVIAFAVLMAMTVLSDVARRLGWIDGEMEKRAIGLVIGSMAIVTGNYLPKMRLFQSPNRVLGWLLVIAGSAYIALFVIAPLALARQAAAMIGVAVIVMIAILWQPLRIGVRQPAIAMLLTFVYLLSTAVVVYVFGRQHWTEWLHGAFFVTYLVLYTLGEKQCLRN